MEKEKLQVILEEQQKHLIDVLHLDVEEVSHIQDTIQNLVSTQEKIKSLNSYVESYKEEIRDYMVANNINTLYSSKGKATYRIGDSTSIKKDLVLMVIDEFKCGKRDTLDYKDVTVTKEMEAFRVRPIKVDEE